VLAGRPQGSNRCETKVKRVWGSFVIAAAALETPTINGYTAQGVNLNCLPYCAFQDETTIVTSPTASTVPGRRSAPAGASAEVPILESNGGAHPVLHHTGDIRGGHLHGRDIGGEHLHGGDIGGGHLHGTPLGIATEAPILESDGGSHPVLHRTAPLGIATEVLVLDSDGGSCPADTAGTWGPADTAGGWGPADTAGGSRPADTAGDSGPAGGPVLDLYGRSCPTGGPVLDSDGGSRPAGGPVLELDGGSRPVLQQAWRGPAPPIASPRAEGRATLLGTSWRSLNFNSYVVRLLIQHYYYYYYYYY